MVGNEVYWTLPQTLIWFGHRQHKLVEAWGAPPWEEEKEAIQAAESVNERFQHGFCPLPFYVALDDLRNAAKNGSVSVVGWSASGDRTPLPSPIPPLMWVDMAICLDGGRSLQTGKVEWINFRFERGGILALWPENTQETSEKPILASDFPKKNTGRQPRKRLAVVAAMKAAIDAKQITPKDLHDMPYKVLEHTFGVPLGAGKTICQEARIRVLTELNAIPNSGK
jgi:hypothetical protein